MIKILVTAIGSMSAPDVIRELSTLDEATIIGTDIYPNEWQVNLNNISKFYQVTKANSTTYIQEILDICISNHVQFIIPLTDPEVDVLSINRDIFENNNITICISSRDTISTCRDKLLVEQFFQHDSGINTIPSIDVNKLDDINLYPIIAKPRKGRSSEGLSLLRNPQNINAIDCLDDYLFQPYIDGSIFTVDYIRDTQHNSYSIVRKELIRTSNGAGIVVEVDENKYIENIVYRIGETLNVLGCINIEFLFDGEIFYLMDINPRFSAGVGFSVKAGYNFVLNHLECFKNKAIEDKPTIRKTILKKGLYIMD